MDQQVPADAIPSVAASMLSGAANMPISGATFYNAAGDITIYVDGKPNVERMTSSQGGISGSRQAGGDGVCEPQPSTKGKEKFVSGGEDNQREMSQREIDGVSTHPSTTVPDGGDDIDNQTIVCDQKQENMRAGDTLPGNSTENVYGNTSFSDQDKLEIISLATESCGSCSREMLPKVVQYSRLLMHHKLGYPLYCPEPNAMADQTYREQGVLIGDIGHVNFLGEFDVAMNIYNSGDLSTSIKELKLRQDDPVIRKSIAPETVYRSKNVHYEHVPQRRQFKVKCKSPDGAFLALPEGGILLDATNKEGYMKLAECHAESWYKYIITGKRWTIENGALFLVTGYMKSKQWGITTFDEPSEVGDVLHFSSSFWRKDKYKWRPVIPEVTKTGPISRDIPKTALNQCTFIRGYRIMLRQAVYDRLKHTTCVLSDAGSSSEPTRGQQSPFMSNAQEQSSDAATGQTQSSPYTTKCASMEYEDPSDVINKILLQEKPEAKVALTHSDDLNYVLTDNGMLDPTSLNKIKECIEFHEEHSCVTISVKDTEPQPGQPVNYPQSWSDVLTAMPVDLDSIHASTVLQMMLSILKNIKKCGSSNTSVVDATTIDLICKLFSSKEYDGSLAALLTDPSDTKNLLDCIFQLLHRPSITNMDGAIKQRARQFMLEVVTETPMIPESLIVNGVRFTVPVKHSPISGGALGHVFKGELLGNVVALKELFKADDNIAFCREALMWGSLSHEFVLPLSGIYQDDELKLFISPYMENGTLAQWRKKVNPSTAEVEQHILEVSKGLEYIHSEGVVHGDLRGVNVLLDANLHVQITGFGLAGMISEAKNIRPGALHSNFAAPELFCDDSEKGSNVPIRTQESDVYAFGCLYYEIHYDSIPLMGQTDDQIMRLHSQKAHPPRLDSPPLSDEAWELIRSCWMSEASKRPRIEEVTLRMVIANLLRSRSVTLKPALRARDPSYEAPSIFESISRKLGTDAYHDIPPYPPFPNEIGQSHMLEYPYNLPIPRTRPKLPLQDVRDGETTTRYLRRAPTPRDPHDEIPLKAPWSTLASSTTPPSTKDLSAALKAGLEFYASPNFSHPDPQFPTTKQGDENTDVLTMWQNVTINPNIKDADLNKLYDEIISRAKYDGTKMVLEPRDARYIDEVTDRSRL